MHEINFVQSSAPEINWGRGGGTINRQFQRAGPSRPPARQNKTPYLSLTSEMPHLRILPRSRLCQNLTRRNALQIFGYVSAGHILAARRSC